MPENACIVRHNLLDARYYDTLMSQSALLQQLDTAIRQIAPDSSCLLQDLYCLLYKKVLVLEDPVPATLHGLILEELAHQEGLRKLRTRTAGNRAETHAALWVLTQDLLERLRGAVWVKECAALLQTLEDRPAALQNIDGNGQEPDAPLWMQDFWKGLLTQQGSEALRGIASKLKGDSGLAEQVSILEELAEQAAQPQPSAGGRPAPLSAQALSRALSASENSHTPADAFLEAALGSLSPQAETLSAPSGADRTSVPLPSTEGAESPGAPSPLSESSEKTSAALKGAAEAGRLRLAGFIPGTWRGNEPPLMVPAQEGADARRILAAGPPDTSKVPTAMAIGAEAVHSLPPEHSPLESAAGLPIPGSAAAASAREKELVLKKVRSRLERLQASTVLKHSVDQLDQLNEQFFLAGASLQDLDHLPYDALIGQYKRTLDPLMVRFFNKVGQKREIARQAQHKKKARRDLQVDRIRQDDDLDSILDEELTDLSMGIEAFENSFIDRFLHKNLLTLARVTRTARHKGPIILCYDGSGSMEGDKIWETKAHILAFTEVARRQKRRMITIQFSSASEPLFVRELHPRRVQFAEILELMDTFLRGGTDFEHPLKEAMKYLETDRFRNGDILFITDGICGISETFKRRFLDSKADKKFKLYAVIIHGNTYRDYGDLSDIADEILEIRQRDLSEWNEKVSERIFSI